jgi:uncharacterized membrane protein YjdF
MSFNRDILNLTIFSKIPKQLEVVIISERADDRFQILPGILFTSLHWEGVLSSVNAESNRFSQNLLRKILDGIFLAIQVALMLGLADKGYPDFIRSVAATTLVWIGYVWLESRQYITMNNYVRAVVMLTIISDGFFGYYLGYYVTSNVFDKLLHIWGTYAFSLFAYVLAVQQMNSPLPRMISCILIISLGISLGALYEIAEFLVDSFGNPVLPGQPSLHDTDLDLIGDTIGAILAAIHLQYAEFVERHS